MLTFTITWQRYKDLQSKMLYVTNKIWQNGDDQLWNNIDIYINTEGTTI